MWWFALQWPEPLDAAQRATCAWRALACTPRVAWAGDVLLLEVSACLRLWGGRARLGRRLAADFSDSSLQNRPLTRVNIASGATDLIAVALLRLAAGEGAAQARRPPGRGADGRAAAGLSPCAAAQGGGQAGRAPDAQGPGLPAVAAVADPLPLVLLEAATPHLQQLARLGLHRWGDLRALPRPALARRFGPALLQALDVAYGVRPPQHRWIEPPARFDLALDLPTAADSAPALLPAARRLLTALGEWLRARQRGAVALQWQWRHDTRRLNGRELAARGGLEIRTARAVQAMDHLLRLTTERLARTPLAAPVVQLRLRSLRTEPWTGETASLLPDERPTGDALHEFVERVQARLGPQAVRRVRLVADARPECMQHWEAIGSDVPVDAPAEGPTGGSTGGPPPAPVATARGGRRPRARPGSKPQDPSALPPQAALYPPWLLERPLPLTLREGRPWHRGPLRLLTPAHRIETGWWDSETPARRDYFIARGPQGECWWVFCELPRAGADGDASAGRWFLHGRYV